MSRLTWNDCCCNPISGLTGDMVLVRAGWYHFLVMTLDGRVNCFVGSGLEGSRGITWNGYSDRDTRRIGAIGSDWARVHQSVMFTDEDNGGNGVLKVGTPDPLDPISNRWQGLVEWQADVLIHVPVDSTRYRTKWYNCTETTDPGIVGSSIDVPSIEWLFDTANGICRKNPTGSNVSGCWYNRNAVYAFDPADRANNYTDRQYTSYWPHGYMEFDGSGCTIGRPWKIGGYTYSISGDYPNGATVGFAGGVTSERWQYLITKQYGIFGYTLGISFSNYIQPVRGADGVTFWIADDIIEEYKPTAIVAPLGHPLRVPSLPTIEDKPAKVIDIECGAYHNIIRLENNSIMCWGLNSMGQCNVPQSLKPGATNRHPKIDKIVSIHAGFSTSAVLFNDGTALCWGDPEVACAVNNWTDIRVSPIKRNNGTEGVNCIGAGSDGYPDPLKPYYPENKNNNPTYNANTDWFQYWRKGTAGHPHFDLGVEVNPIYPVNWSVLGTDGGYGGIDNPIVDRNTASSFNVFDPKVWCEDCAGLTIGKDFAVAMLRSGQIVTSRKTNAPEAGKNINLSRDCSTDTAFYRDSGSLKPQDAGVHVLNEYFCCGGNVSVFNQFGNTVVTSNMNKNVTCFDQLYSPNAPLTSFVDQDDYIQTCQYQDGDLSAMPKSCIAQAKVTYPDIFECTEFICDSYKRWLLPAGFWRDGPSGLSCTDPDSRKNISSIPEGVGCFSNQITELGYDPNWAAAGLYTAGQQVRNDSFTGGRYPSWNKVLTAGANGVGVNYGWSTLPAVSSRYQPGTLDNIDIVPACRAETIQPARCAITQGLADPCDWFCPSKAGGFHSTQMGGIGGSQKNIPGLFRYPEHIVGALTCVAGVNTVAWVSRSKLIQPESLALATSNGWITESRRGMCEQYHLNDSNGLNHETPNKQLPNLCSECGVVGWNPGEHTTEVGDTSYGCIFANHPDADGFNNPFRESNKTGWCKAPRQIPPSSSMLPSRPWGPWNVETDSGFSDPNISNYAICHRGLNASAPYVSYRNAGQGQDGLQLLNLPWRPYFGPGMPYWFQESCDQRDITDEAGYPVYTARTWHGAIMGYYYPDSLSYWYIYDNITSNVIEGRDEQNPEDGVLTEDGTSKYDCYSSTKTCGCTPNKISYLWANDARTHCDSSTSSLVDNPERSAPGWKPSYSPPPSGQSGVTCGVGSEDAINRWCFNNPVISYATGRSFGVYVRACPWVRGISGEFIWKNSCEENSNYFSSIGKHAWLNSTNKQTKSLKLWISGVLEDPCPPWPVDVNINGLTYGRYPSWVPVAATNTNKRAQKGQWIDATGSWSECLSNYEWCDTAWGYTCGCTGPGCIGGEIGWPSGVTGCTGGDDKTPLGNYPHGWIV